MLDANASTHLRTSSLFSLALAAVSAVLAGCTIVVGDHHGHGKDDPWEQCYEDYDDCLDEADGNMHAVKACGEQLDACSSDGTDAATTGAGSGAGESAGQGESAGESAGQGESAGESAGDSDGSAGEVPADVCVSLHQTCIAGAQDLADTLACEALFDHCAHPGECPEDSCPKACPEAGLAACLVDYTGCVAGATKDYQVDACNLVFGGCIAELGAPECLPADDAHRDACLAEHALCTACATSDAELAACKDIFDVCIAPPM